jgi:hypothetical protein
MRDMTLDSQAGLIGLFSLGQIPHVLSRKGIWENPTRKRYVGVREGEAGSCSEGGVV